MRIKEFILSGSADNDLDRWGNLTIFLMGDDIYGK